MPPVPQPPTLFVGRDRELNEIAALLADPACRLLTLVGSGGIGKTRLGLQAALQQQAYYDEVAFVALTAINSPDFIPSAIGAALDIPFFGSQDPLRHIMSYLHDRRMLLVMDNFEHVIEGVGCLTDLLHAAPHLKIIVTSRERLNLSEEWVFVVGGLSYPAIPATDASSYSAVQLFVQRARQSQQQFVLSEHIDAVQSICRQVEGMPLGLELAASWLRAMSCEQVAARMASNLDFLTTSFRNVPERHRSLRVVFQQSWSLLFADEQTVLMRLSLFHGGFDLDAANAVAGASLSTLAGLIDKSLLRMDDTGRYDLQELVRQYAGEKLAESGQLNATMQRYLAYFLALAESGERSAYGRDQRTWYDRLALEMDNLRAALSWSISTQDVETGLRMASALRWVWEMRGHLPEGLTWFKSLLAIDHPVSPAIRANALHRASELAGQLADEAQAGLWIEEALSVARSTHDQWNMAWALSTGAYFTEQNRTQAEAMLRESLALFRGLNDGLGLSHTLRRLAGCLIEQGKYDEAVDLLNEALRGDRQADDKSTVAWDLCFMGVVLWTQHHDSAQVIPLYEESVALFREIRDQRGMAHPLVMLAEAERSAGDATRAHIHFHDTLRLEREFGIRDHLALFAITGLASLVAHEKPDQAARLLGAVSAVLDSGLYGTRLQTLMDIFKVAVADARAQLDEAEFEVAWTNGRTMSLEQALTEALLIEAPSIDLAREITSPLLIEALSPREFEVLKLVGEGLSNAEIAQILFISVATVKVHTRSIYGKLSVANRTQAIVQARKLNLL